MIDFIKDADCTKETPVKLGVPDAPIYGKGIKLKPRTGQKHHKPLSGYRRLKTASLALMAWWM